MRTKLLETGSYLLKLYITFGWLLPILDMVFAGGNGAGWLLVLWITHLLAEMCRTERYRQ